MIRAYIAHPVRLTLVLIGLAHLPAAALAAGLHLNTGATRVISFSAPAASFHIADPAILDARAVDDSHVELIGKASGSTDIVAYDATGRRLYSNRVSVGGHGARTASRGDSGTVLYQRGAEQRIVNCGSGKCQSQAAGAQAAGAPPQGATP